MYKFFVVFSAKWPWVSVNRADILHYPPVVVIVPDGRYGVIHHFKTDGNFGVRPVDQHGNFLDNVNAHWTIAQNKQIPQELALSYAQLTAVVTPPGWAK